MKTSYSYLFICCCICFSNLASAQLFEPANVKVAGVVKVVPTIENSYQFNDNIYSQESDEVSSSIYLFKPSFKLKGQDGANWLEGLYAFKSGFYSENSKNNFIDQDLGVKAYYELSSKNVLNVQMRYLMEHDDRGRGLSEGKLDEFIEPIQYDKFLLSTHFRHGGQKNPFKVGMGIRFESKNYANFKHITKERSYESVNALLDLEFLYNRFTSFTLDMKYSDYDYALSDFIIQRDNVDQHILLGVKWKESVKMGAWLKYGYQNKNFSDNARRDFSGANYDIGMFWAPRTYSKVKFNLNRGAKDPRLSGDYTKESKLSLAWNHYWNKRFSTDIAYIWEQEHNVGNERHDLTIVNRLKLNYDLLRWLQISLSYEYENKNSNDLAYPFDRGLFSFNFNVGL